MKKKIISVLTICAVGLGFMLQSCIGSFALTNKLLAWNQTIDNKFVNELVFFAFWIVPVYEVSALADILVLNSIEFWSGQSPVASTDTMVEGRDGQYLVHCDANGYKITNESGRTIELHYTPDTQAWSVVGESGTEHLLLMYVDDSHVKVPGIDGEMMTVELSQAGLYAYQSEVLGAMVAQK